MEPFTTLTGVAAPLLRDDINTDQITPINRNLNPDWAALLFANAPQAAGRQRGSGLSAQQAAIPHARHSGDRPQFRLRLLARGRGVGACSRPAFAASWRAASPTSTGRIACRTACCRSSSSRPTRKPSRRACVAADGATPFTVDLQAQSIGGPGGPDLIFEIAPADRMRLLEGLDDIGLTLKHAHDIAVWEERMAGAQPWLQAAADLAALNGEPIMNVRKKLRALMAQPGLTLMPGAYDALSARIIEAQGFEAIGAGGYAAVGSMLAQPDTGQSNMRDYADHYARICAAVELPVYVDGDTGFGGVNNARQMVRAFEAAGVAGFFISDQTFPNRCGYLPGKQVVRTEEMLAKIKAMLDARRDGDLLICARTDVVAIEGLGAGIERCQLFMEAGADMAKPMGADTIDEIKRVLREVPGPHMATISQAAGAKHRDLGELEAAGVAAVSFPSVALFAAAEAVRQAMAALKRDRSLAALSSSLMPLPDYYELIGLKAQLAREEAYDRAAAALASKRAAE